MKVEADSHVKGKGGDLTEDEEDILRAEDEGMPPLEPSDDEPSKTLRDDLVQGGTPG